MNDDTVTTAMLESVPPVDTAALTGQLVSADEQLLLSFRGTFDARDVRHAAKVIQAASPQDLEPDKHGVLEMRLVDFTIYPSEAINRETGEVSPTVQCVLWDVSGAHWKTTSRHFPARLWTILALWRGKLPREGVRVRVSERTGKSQRDYHDLRIIEETNDAE